MPRPDAIVAGLRRHDATVATAESLTGGAVCAALVGVAGASAVVRGGVIAYTAEMKQRLLGVDPEVIERAGVVSEAVASAMAEGAREATGATVAVATTGVAGPEGHGGLPPGRVCVAVAAVRGSTAVTLDLAGDRDGIRAQAVDAALRLVGEWLEAADTGV